MKILNKRCLKQLIAPALAVLFSASVASFAAAQTPEQKARSIGDAMAAATSGFGDSEIVMNMEIVNKKGRASKRTFKINSLEGKQDNPKVLLVFSAPKDLKGTALLTHAHASKPNDQWLFFPSTKRVKKIASSGSSGAFLGSEFTYEDLGGFDLDNYTSRWVKESAIAGQVCDLIENVPTGRSGYSKVLACISKANKTPLDIKFYDKRNRHLKTLSNSNFKKYKGKYWLAHNVSMKNHVTGKATHLKIQKAAFGVGLKDNYFSQSNLKNLR